MSLTESQKKTWWDENKALLKERSKNKYFRKLETIFESNKNESNLKSEEDKELLSKKENEENFNSEDSDYKNSNLKTKIKRVLISKLENKKKIINLKRRKN